MKFAIAMVLGVALLCDRASALDPWTKADTAWEVGFAAAVALDVGQTRFAMKQGMSESNPLLGRHPSGDRLLGAGLLAVASHAAVSALLPSGWRQGWQAVSLALEVGAVGMNSAHVGLRVEF